MSSKKTKDSSNSAKKNRHSSIRQLRVANSPDKHSSHKPGSQKACDKKAIPVPNTSANVHMHKDFDWLGALRAQRNPKAAAIKTYKVLSQPIRHELNKYFFDVTDTPSRAERKQLLEALWLIDYTVTKVKLTKYFQNKRHYVKNHPSERHTLPTVNLKHARTTDSSGSDSDSE